MKTFEAENAWFTFKVDNPDLFEENWRNWDNYKSPISVIVPDVFNQLEINIEKSVASAISDLGISVDKAELIRALQYDRGQYVVGFRDGLRAANEQIVHCEDCKHSRMYAFGDESGGEVLACLTIEEDGFVRFATGVAPDHFCGYGERKDNE